MSERRVIKCNVYMYINSSCQGGTPGVVADPILFAFRFYFLFDFVLFAPSLYFSSSYIAVALLVDYDDVCFLFLFLFLRRLLLRWRLLRLGRSTRSRVVGRWSRRSLLQRVGRLHRLVPVDHRVEIAFYHHNYRFVIIIIKNFFGWWGFFCFVLRTKWKRKTKW